MRRTALLLGAVLAAIAVGCSRRSETVRPAPRRPPNEYLPPRADTPAAALPESPFPDNAPSTVGPFIRVGIAVDRDSVIVSATGTFRVIGADGNAVAVLEGGDPVTVRAGDRGGRVLVLPAGQGIVSAAAPVRILPERPADHVVISARRYRGEAFVARGTAGVTAINMVPLEHYLLSVVALELGFRGAADRQAVMAQAVAARTYAMRYRGRREALGFDVFPTDADQVYSGIDAELPEVSQAVRDTKGEILTWEGRPIEALFHSTCGWSTEDAREIFASRGAAPYLRAVSDRTGDGPRDFYCAISPRFRWREEWDAGQFQAVARRALQYVRAPAGSSPRVTDVRTERSTPTGRVAQLVISTNDGAASIPAGRIREIMRTAGGAQLNSTMFQLHLEKNGGQVTRVIAAGGGYGHGVGMCQFGAAGRSRAGFSYNDILATYYHGTTLERIY